MSSPYLDLQREQITWPDGTAIASPDEVFSRTPTRLTDILLKHKDSLTGLEEVRESHTGIEVPEHWTDLQAQILATKYCRGRNSRLSVKQESSYKEVFGRIVRKIGKVGLEKGYFKSKREASEFTGRLAYAMTNGWCMFNSPVLFNIGAEDWGQPQTPSACFLIGISDSIDSILDTYRVEGKIFQGGSGVGLNLSKLRAKGESLRGGGSSSGPISFMRGLDASAGSIKSGGTTRRAAILRCMDDWHLDVEEFIQCKSIGERVAAALATAGFSTMWNEPGGAYDYSPFQNSNNSVRLSDAFMRSYERDGDWTLHGVVDKTRTKTVKARNLLSQMAQACWESGDPGVQFSDTITAMHTCPNSGPITTANPCAEYNFLDNTSCNLASITLTKFVDESGRFLNERFAAITSMLCRAMDILIEQGEFPDPKIDKGTRDTRPLGIGYSDLGAMLMGAGLGYASPAGLSAVASITAYMTAVGYRESAHLAQEIGPFALYEENMEPFLEVMRKHHQASAQITSTYGTARLTETLLGVDQVWSETVEAVRKYGARNAQMTVTAPVGTISFLMDNSTTGIEPAGGVVLYKNLAGGGVMRLTLGCIKEGLESLGYSPAEVQSIIAYANLKGTLQPFSESGIHPEHEGVFLTAFQSAPGDRTLGAYDHLRILEATQPFLSGASSKTINCPNETTAEQIEAMYVDAWKMGIKCIAVYRDGSKGSQVISSQKKETEKIEEKLLTQEIRPVRKRLPAERQSITRKFQVGMVEGYISVSLFPDTGLPGEVFVNISKEGSTLSGLLDAFATSVSLNLQYGVPLEAMVEKFAMTRFEPSGFTGDPDAPMATSIIDYLFRWMSHRFLQDKEPTVQGSHLEQPTEHKPTAIGVCTKCGQYAMIPDGHCKVCSACGSQEGGCSS